MSKMSEMEATIRELRDIASSINDIANWLTDAFGSADGAEAAPVPAPEKTYSLEEVTNSDTHCIKIGVQL